jgi:ribosomal protein S18 acetylase RimI-like enzyme
MDPGEHPQITLVPPTAHDLEALVREEIANYVAERIRDGGWTESEALDRARAELGPVLDRELAEAGERGHGLWSAVDADGVTVGWLWVRPVDGRPRSAFLYQITVAEAVRRKGYGQAMLAALECRLAGDGIDELRLHVNLGNLPAQRLYAAAGYEQADAAVRVRLLRKTLRATP